MNEVEGWYYDGKSSASLPARVQLQPRLDLVLVRGQGFEREYKLSASRISQRIGHIARRIEFPDGASFETPDNDAIDFLVRGRQVGPGLLHGLESRWGWVLVSVVATVLIVWSSIYLGIPYLAEKAAYAIPVELETQMGKQALKSLDKLAFSPSSLNERQQERGRRLLAELLPPESIEARLEYRRMDDDANAFTLPSGLIVVTDKLMELASRDEELQAVLAHELGHIHYRHSLRGWLQDSAAALLAATVLGDVGSISANVAVLPTLLLDYRYSREFETQADDFAVQTLARKGIAPCHLGAILARMEAAEGEESASAPDFLSTHPATDQRIRRLTGGNLGCGKESTPVERGL